MSAVQIRRVRDDDDMERITDVIHRGYAALAAKGLRFWGSHQSVEDTIERFAGGIGFVAERDGRIVGTLTVRPPQPESEVEIYRDPHTWCLTQFAVDPDHGGHGIGHALHDAAVDYARAHGARRIALDTAEQADELIAMYTKWGYSIIGACDWRPFTNYASVVMGITIEPATKDV